MFTHSHVALPTDFSHYASHASRYALALAKQYDGTVHLIHVLDAALYASTGSGLGVWLTQKDSDNLLHSMRDHAESRLEHLVRSFEEAGVKAYAHVAQGNPCQEIIKTAKETDCDLIVIATHGRSGLDHIVFGSVCERVVRQSPVPVLSVKRHEHEFVERRRPENILLRRILFPTDFSDFAARTLDYPVSLCREFGAELILFHAAEVPLVLPEYAPDLAGTARREVEQFAQDALAQMKDELEGVSVNVQVRPGPPHKEICRAAEELRADLIVMPTHGRSGLAHILFGSVAEKVVRLAQCPVLTIRPEQARRAAPAAAV